MLDRDSQALINLPANMNKFNPWRQHWMYAPACMYVRGYLQSGSSSVHYCHLSIWLQDERMLKSIAEQQLSSVSETFPIKWYACVACKSPTCADSCMYVLARLTAVCTNSATNVHSCGCKLAVQACMHTHGRHA